MHRESATSSFDACRIRCCVRKIFFARRGSWYCDWVSEKSPPELLKDAEEVLRALRVGARRAFVLELTGTPKAGKTTTLSTLQAFFKTAGFRVETLKERAADCPLPMKGHFFFNAWTMCTMLAEVLANHETPVDVLLLDRGFFDALIWLDLQHARSQVTEEERRVFEEFVLLERWQSLVDFTIIMTTGPQKAMEREQVSQLIPRAGSMMNVNALTQFNDAMERTIARHGSKFRHVVIDTSNSADAKQSCIRLLSEALPVLMDWANPLIEVVPREIAENVFSGRHYLDQVEALAALEKLCKAARPMHRVDAEQDDQVVQIVVGGVPVRAKAELMVFKRDSKDEKSTAYGSRILWRGCHVEHDETLTLATLAKAISERLQSELHLRTALTPEIIGLASPGSEITEGVESPDRRHLGVLFKVEVNDAVAKSLHDKAFKKSGRGHPFTGQFRRQEDIIAEIDSLDLEPWSKHIVQNWRIDA